MSVAVARNPEQYKLISEIEDISLISVVRVKINKVRQQRKDILVAVEDAETGVIIKWTGCVDTAPASSPLKISKAINPRDIENPPPHGEGRRDSTGGHGGITRTTWVGKKVVVKEALKVEDEGYLRGEITQLAYAAFLDFTHHTNTAPESWSILMSSRTMGITW